MRNILVFITFLSLILSCGRVKETAKETINSGGEMVGKTAAEFIEGVSEGVSETIDCEVELSQDLISKGLSKGKYVIESENSSNNNKLITYLIFENDFSSELKALVFDKNGIEIGRSSIAIEKNAGEAGYFDFVFDERTHIETKSIIKIQ